MLPEDSHQQLYLDLASRQRRSFEGECSRQRKCLRFLSTHRQNPSCEEEELCTRSPRVVLDGGPHQTRDSAAFLLEAGKMAIIAGHVEVKRFHLHIGGQTSLEGLIQVTYKPGDQSRDLVEAQMIELLDEILEVGYFPVGEKLIAP